MIVKKIIAQRGDRLDSIVYKEYKILKIFDKVLEANSHLINKIVLDDKDVVNLPIIKFENNKGEKLW